MWLGRVVGLGNANVCGICSAAVSSSEGNMLQETRIFHVFLSSSVTRCVVLMGVKKIATGAGCSQLTHNFNSSARSQNAAGSTFSTSSDMLLMHLQPTPPKQVVPCAHAQQPVRAFSLLTHQSCSAKATRPKCTTLCCSRGSHNITLPHSTPCVWQFTGPGRAGGHQTWL